MQTRVHSALNNLITQKMSASSFYLSAAAYFMEKNRPGFSLWMTAQARKQTTNTAEFISYLESREGLLALGAMKSPAGTYASIRDVFVKTLLEEKKITAGVNMLYAAAQEARDNQSLVFFERFIHEQAAQEKELLEIMARLTLLQDDSRELELIDTELAGQARLVREKISV